MHKHLQGVELLDTGSKKEYSIHVILGASEYPNIKMRFVPRVEEIQRPMAELLGLVE